VNVARIKKVAGLTLRARSAIVFGLVMGLTVFMLPGSLLGIEVVSANAAAGDCPGPANPGSAHISFINPSAGLPSAKPEVSAKPKSPSSSSDPESTAYHLNSWVSNPPANPLVQYYWSDGTDVVPIGFATRVGTSDTFEYFWDSGSMPDDGPYQLCAVLNDFDSTTQTATPVALATQDVVVNNQDPADNPADPDPRGDTVEITYPLNAGALGTYTPPSPTGTNTAQAAKFVMDVKVSSGTGGPDPGTTWVRLYYSLTPPGATEPTWKDCDAGASKGNAVKVTQGKVNSRTCTLAAGDNPASITAVGAVANDTPSQVPTAQNPSTSFDDSGDGHRVFPVAQTPASVTLSPANQQAGPAADDLCAFVTATVMDQESPARQIAGANVDVHASGPTNNVRFDTVGTSSQGPQNHSNETSYDCKSGEEGPSNNLEGLHVATTPGGLNTKHIESAAGTDSTGAYKFALHSSDLGTTSLVAWADTNDNDVQEFGEPSASGSV
ncbi:MAG: hypothetical protein M3290_04550, partial [Actinomycetota bacterium]|nr:hypothetical protein [Actinomycetota bacterium]